MENKNESTFDSSSVNAALTRIKNTLNYSLKENYGIEDPEITEKFLHMHGLDKSRFDFINNFETLIEKGIADESVDTNANKCDKSIMGYFSEVALPIRKLVGYRYLYRKIKELYGKKRAKYLTGLLYDMSLALADSTSILVPYCFSVNASKLVMEGRPFGSLPSGAPHRINSYVAALSETIHQLSSHLAGAIAVGSYFLDLAHIMIYREHKTLSDLRNSEYRKYVENTHQAFIHSVNMLSRNGGVESPFVNISVFDKPKLRALLNDDNMGWYFQKEDIADGIPEETLKDCGDRDWIEYIIDMIIQIEDIYLDVMDKGDPLHDNRPIEFPVTTCLPEGEFIYINGKVDRIENFFKDFNDGWTGVSELYTIGPDGNNVKIKGVYKGFSDNLIKIKVRGSDKTLAFTPDHLCVLEDGTKVKARDLKKNDRLAYIPQISDKFRYKSISDASNHIEDSSAVVVNIEFISSPMTPVYNIEVDNESHTYMLPCGIVTSNCNISRTTDESGNRYFEDPEAVDWYCSHDIPRYNIYLSEGMKVASCLSYNTPFTFTDKDENTYTMPIGDYVETRLDNTDLGDEDAIEKYLDGSDKVLSRHGEYTSIVRVVKLKNKSGRIVRINFTSGDQLWCTPDHELMLKNEELVKAQDLIPGSLLYKHLEVKDIDIFDSDEPVYDVEVNREDHLYKINLPSGLNITTHNCCRLVNNNELFEFGGQVNSFGGTALSLGSHRVVTVNIRRCSLMAKSYEDFEERLGQKMDEAAEVLYAHKMLIKDLISRGTQPFIENGWLDLDRMFSTIGIMGYYEADQDFKKTYGEDDYLKKMIHFINNKAIDITRRYEGKIIVNVEEIPGESMGARLASTDHWIFDGPDPDWN